MNRSVLIATSLVLAAVLHAQISLDTSNSNWGTGGMFSAGAMFTSLEAPSGAYYGGNLVDANTYVFGLVNTPTPTGIPGDYNLASTLVTAGTSLQLTFTGLTAVPDYIAYTGGALTAYSYNAGTLALTVSTIDPVASASDPAGTVLGSSFGLMIVTGSALNFSGTVFRADMFWDDINPLANYSGTDFVAGLNAAGQNGVAAAFSAYVPMTFLNAHGINAPDDVEARLQKDGQASILLGGLSIAVFTPTNPGFPDEGTVWNYGGVPTLDFDGVAGNDNYVLATYTNSNWSNGNIGLSAVPEPPVYVLLLGALSWLAWWRRGLHPAA
ncbi:MAG: hypothetical protein HYV95_14000 [Opitutae bacterium]|nr:hypothetical protein [Opitutae bacterium]